MKDEEILESVKAYGWLQSYLDNTEGRERLQDYVHYVAKVIFFLLPFYHNF